MRATRLAAQKLRLRILAQGDGPRLPLFFDLFQSCEAHLDPKVHVCQVLDLDSFTILLLIASIQMITT